MPGCSRLCSIIEQHALLLAGMHEDKPATARRVISSVEPTATRIAANGVAPSKCALLLHLRRTPASAVASAPDVPTPACARTRVCRALSTHLRRSHCIHSKREYFPASWAGVAVGGVRAPVPRGYTTTLVQTSERLAALAA